jgi:hypothetical protein
MRLSIFLLGITVGGALCLLEPAVRSDGKADSQLAPDCDTLSFSAGEGSGGLSARDECCMSLGRLRATLWQVACGADGDAMA